jgi:hypothetical protein
MLYVHVQLFTLRGAACDAVFFVCFGVCFGFPKTKF